MDSSRKNRSGIRNHLILIGIIFSLIYWLCESCFQAFIFYEGSLAQQLFPRDANELWMRSIVVFIILIFATYVQFLFTKLTRAEDRLQKTREEFIAMLMHDLKSPLASMMAYAQIIQDPRKGEIAGAKREYALTIYRIGEVMSGIISNMVNASKIEAGQSDFHFEEFPLDQMLTELAGVFEPLAQPGAVNIEFSCPPGLIVFGDRNKIRQVFYNLLGNALRFTPQGGNIYIRVLQKGHRAAIEVEDTGKGIPESEHRKIFEKFVQAEGERHSTGLGLYIVRNYLAGHGSDITVRSQEGKGACFLFSLPLREGAVRDQGAAPERAPAS